MIGRKIYDCMIREQQLYEAIVELFFFYPRLQFNETKALFVFASLREERKVKRLKLTL